MLAYVTIEVSPEALRDAHITHAMLWDVLSADPRWTLDCILYTPDIPGEYWTAGGETSDKWLERSIEYAGGDLRTRPYVPITAVIRIAAADTADFHDHIKPELYQAMLAAIMGALA